MGKVIALLSGKGGTGKSTVAAFWGRYAASHGKKTVLIDLNTGMREMDMLLGMESRMVFDLSDVLEEICPVEQALVQERESGVYLLAAPQMCANDELDAERLAELTAQLKENFDYIILDGPAGIGQGVAAACRAAETAVVVALADDAGLRAADRISGLLQRLDMPPPEVLLNRLERDFLSDGLQYRPSVCSEVLDLPILGAIPEEAAIRRSALEKKGFDESLPAAKALENAWFRLEKPEIPMFFPFEEEENPLQGKGIFARLKRKKDCRMGNSFKL